MHFNPYRALLDNQSTLSSNNRKVGRIEYRVQSKNKRIETSVLASLVDFQPSYYSKLAVGKQNMLERFTSARM